MRVVYAFWSIAAIILIWMLFPNVPGSTVMVDALYPLAVKVGAVRFHPWPMFNGPFPPHALFIASRLFGLSGDVATLCALVGMTSLLLLDPIRMAVSVSKRNGFVGRPLSWMMQTIMLCFIAAGIAIEYIVQFSGIMLHTKDVGALFVAIALFSLSMAGVVNFLALGVSMVCFDLRYFHNRRSDLHAP
jgi:hypothetical protein